MNAPCALVIAPHPDDEVLGAGGTIARLAGDGWRVVVVVVCSDLPPTYPAGIAEEVEAEAREAHALLGVAVSEFLHLPSVELSRGAVTTLNGPLQALVEEHRPTLALIPFPDRHVDHRTVFDASMVVTRPVGAGRDLRTVAMYETVSETFWNAPGAEPTFTPSWHVDITETVRTKIDAFRCFASQLQPDPGPRSVRALESLAGFRGSQVGLSSAESFQVVRSVSPVGPVMGG
ncbi:PIG-L deacetylase family protein [Brachybacterium sp. GCM10030252]|uniref:PIG-L deacetylase family protein n=1 Tax=Brachybacterium sp. GCM10030252 TaxID=3273380 RepID=UPI00361FB669